ncbi:MAG: hydrogenase formation protein HypD, partial [Pseudomonadota bacterium]
LPPAMEALLESGELQIDGFICPGHVTTIIGIKDYEAVAGKYRTPCVVTGFEPVDILQGVLMLTEFIEQGRPDVAIQYKRGAAPRGNPRALEVMYTVFEPVDAPWRGLGLIPKSGLGLRKEFQAHDARVRFDLEVPPAVEPPGCRCGDVLRGVASPPDCRLYKKVCTPDQPVGACMVSTEGSCAAYFKYHES